MRQLILIAHNLRSCHNVGSLLRTAEGLDASVVLSGYTPYPLMADDSRLPHIATKLAKQINKTALGAEELVSWSYLAELEPELQRLQADGWHIAAIEQADSSTALPDFKPPGKLVLIVGREVEGIEPEILALVDTVLEIPMFGQKESFNVVQAAAMALYHCRFAHNPLPGGR